MLVVLESANLDVAAFHIICMMLSISLIACSEVSCRARTILFNTIVFTFIYRYLVLF